jgi:predicted porin
MEISFAQRKSRHVLRQTVVAAAVACVGVASHAQSSVTLYGAVDTGLMYQSTSAASFKATAPDKGSLFALKDAGLYPSAWGIAGTEDLGDNYRVLFRMQGAFNSTNGAFGLGDNTAPSSSIFNQMSYVGISAPFGTLTLGRQIAPMAWAMKETDARSGEYFGSILISWIGMNSAAGWSGGSTNAPIGALYESNAIVYKSPTFYGVTGSLEYAPGGVAGSFQGNTRESAVLQYSNYGLHLAALYYNGHDTNPIPLTATATGVDNNRMIYFGALYDIANFSVSASYSNGKNPAHTNLVDIDMYSAGLGYQFTPAFKVTSGVYFLKDRNNSINKSTMEAIGAEYDLSKSTLLYAELGHVNNRGDMSQMIAYGELVAPGSATTAVDLGIRHQF